MSALARAWLSDRFGPDSGLDDDPRVAALLPKLSAQSVVRVVTCLRAFEMFFRVRPSIPFHSACSSSGPASE